MIRPDPKIRELQEGTTFRLLIRFGTLVPFLNLNIKHRAEYVMAERHQVAICPHTLHTEQHEYGS